MTKFQPSNAEKVLFHKLHEDGLSPTVQYSVSKYKLDIAFSNLKLDIEVDGPHHKLIKEKDGIRDRYLKSEGWEILRINSDEVYNNINPVVETIRRKILEIENKREEPQNIHRHLKRFDIPERKSLWRYIWNGGLDTESKVLFHIVTLVLVLFNLYFFYDKLKPFLISVKTSFVSLFILILIILVVYVISRILVSLCSTIFYVFPAYLFDRFGWIRILAVITLIFVIWWYYPSTSNIFKEEAPLTTITKPLEISSLSDVQQDNICKNSCKEPRELMVLPENKLFCGCLDGNVIIDSETAVKINSFVVLSDNEMADICKKHCGDNLRAVHNRRNNLFSCECIGDVTNVVLDTRTRQVVSDDEPDNRMYSLGERATSPTNPAPSEEICKPEYKQTGRTIYKYNDIVFGYDKNNLLKTEQGDRYITVYNNFTFPVTLVLYHHKYSSSLGLDEDAQNKFTIAPNTSESVQTLPIACIKYQCDISNIRMDIIEPNITEVPEEITVSACGLINNPTVIEKTSDSFSGDYIAKYTVDGDITCLTLCMREYGDLFEYSQRFKSDACDCTIKGSNCIFAESCHEGKVIKISNTT